MNSVVEQRWKAAKIGYSEYNMTDTVPEELDPPRGRLCSSRTSKNERQKNHLHCTMKQKP